nr:exonuclease domain-containing protein [uncultured Cohaesibacter sp.]
MNYLFYDTETTGVNVAFDQIMQFAAIVTDENFVELGRLNIRCRLLPWIVPSPIALLVTQTTSEDLTNPDLPSHFEMMAEIRNWLIRWRPAVFVGYNSMKFDEVLLHRAFWQTLNPPYVTVTNGNSRLDLLPIIRALSALKSCALEIPLNDQGSKTYKLDKLAPLNGFNSHNAHDALGDVEATIFLARKIAERAPDFWKTLSSRTSKSAVSSVLIPGKAVYILGNSARSPEMIWAQRVDQL